jgi:uroporphyrinogen-III synthase
VLLALAANAAATLEDALAAAGHRVTRSDVYRTIPKPELRPKRRLSTFAADCVFLASPSASRGFTNQVELDCDARIVTIGPTTTAAARAHGLRATRQARTPSLSGLLEAIECA